MLHVLEVVSALLRPGRAPEVVDRNRGNAPLCEAEGELLVEAVEAADVGEDDHPFPAGLLRRCGERREPVSVGALEGEVAMLDRAALDRRDRRQRVQVEAHFATLYPVCGPAIILECARASESGWWAAGGGEDSSSATWSRSVAK